MAGPQQPPHHRGVPTRIIAPAITGVNGFPDFLSEMGSGPGNQDHQTWFIAAQKGQRQQQVAERHGLL
jgi:hypothetical protein